MKPLIIKILLVITISFCVNTAFSQHKNVDTLQLVFPKELEIFTKKIEIAEYNTYFYNEVTLNNGAYKIRNKSQEADFTIENNLISGTATTHDNYKNGEHTEDNLFRTEYKFDKSVVTQFTIFADDTLHAKAHRKGNQVFATEFYKNGDISKEFQTSVAPDKNYGLTITKNFYRDGKIYQIDNEIEQTITQFYENGNKKSVMNKTSTTYFNEHGLIIRKANFKTPPFYDDEFVNGKLSTRSYKNDKSEQIKEYFKNGILEKKELTNTVRAEKTIFAYNKAGKLTSKKSYKIEEEENAKSIVYATAVVNNEPEQYITEKIETAIVEANFQYGNEAYRKFITDNFDTSIIDTQGMIMFELDLTIDKDGTVSLENRQQKIFSSKDLCDEMIRVLRKLPKWNPAKQNGIPMKSSVRFPVTINIQ